MKKLAFLFIAVLLLVPSLNSSAGDVSDGYVDEKDVTEYLNSIKFTFLSWFTGSTKIAYERELPDIRQSAEICAGIISAGYDKYRNDPSGFSLRYGKQYIHVISIISLRTESVHCPICSHSWARSIPA